MAKLGSRDTGRRLLAVAVCVAALGVAVGAEAPAGGRPAGTPAGGPALRIPFPRADGSLTPYTFELGYPLVTLVYDTLLWRDAEGEPRPWLASSVEASPDGRTRTIELAEGARWHDGAPVRAADVVFTFELLRSRPHPRFTPQLRAVERVEALDASTVRIRLRHPAPGFEDQPLSDLPILPEHLWEGLPEGRPAPEGLPVGSGPYRLVAHRPGEGYRFQADADHFRGRPAVEAIDVPVIRGAEETFRALERREVDMVPVSLPPDAAERLEGLGVRVARGASYLGTVLALNLRRPPFDAPEVRRAVARALDLRGIARAVDGAVPAGRGFLHPASEWAPDETLHRFDPEAASRVLRGLEEPIEVLAPEGDPVKLEAGRRVVLGLRRAGGRARLTPLAPDGLEGALGRDGSAPTFEAAISVAPPLASYDPDFLAPVFGSGGPLNAAGYRSAAFDALAEGIAATQDPDERRAAVGEALRLVAEDAPVVPLLFAEGAYAYRPAVHDGWVFVKGRGILDKRSFLSPGAVPAAPPAGADPGAGGSGRSPFGLLSLGLFGLAIVLIAVGLVRQRLG